MKICFREKNPLMSQREILKQVAEIESGRSPLEHWLWTKMLAQMFDATDAFILQDKLRKVAHTSALNRC